MLIRIYRYFATTMNARNVFVVRLQQRCCGCNTRSNVRLKGHPDKRARLNVLNSKNMYDNLTRIVGTVHLTTNTNGLWTLRLNDSDPMASEFRYTPLHKKKVV